MKRRINSLGWRLMGVQQKHPLRGWRWKLYRLGAWMANLT